MKIEASQRLAAAPEWETPCWIVAITKTFGITEAKCKQLALKHGWDGKSFGTQAEICYQIVKGLLGAKPKLDTQTFKGKTARQFAATKPSGAGIVFVKGHVMPWLNGTVSNFNGYSEEPVQFLMYIRET